jgi:hypothetical protein
MVCKRTQASIVFDFSVDYSHLLHNVFPQRNLGKVTFANFARLRGARQRNGRTDLGTNPDGKHRIP